MGKFQQADRIKSLNANLIMKIDEVLYEPLEIGDINRIHTGFYICGWMEEYGYCKHTYHEDELVLVNKGLDMDEINSIRSERNSIFSVLRILTNG